jgi:hypothetical protein
VCVEEGGGGTKAELLHFFLFNQISWSSTNLSFLQLNLLLVILVYLLCCPKKVVKVDDQHAFILCLILQFHICHFTVQGLC